MCHGLMPNLALIEWGNETSESGYYLMKKLLGKNLDITAVVCVNDTVAYGAIKALHGEGLSCPGDISVIGHDGIQDSCEWNDVPAITTISSDFNKIGFEAAKKLRRDIWMDDKTVLNTRFLIKETTAPPKSSRK